MQKQQLLCYTTSWLFSQAHLSLLCVYKRKRDYKRIIERSKGCLERKEGSKKERSKVHRRYFEGVVES